MAYASRTGTWEGGGVCVGQGRGRNAEGKEGWLVVEERGGPTLSSHGLAAAARSDLNT